MQVWRETHRGRRGSNGVSREPAGVVGGANAITLWVWRGKEEPCGEK